MVRWSLRSFCAALALVAFYHLLVAMGFSRGGVVVLGVKVLSYSCIIH